MATSECATTDFADILAQMTSSLPVISEATVVPDVARTPPFCKSFGELLFPVLMMLIGAGVYHIFLGPGAAKKNPSVSGVNPLPTVSPTLQNTTPSVVHTILPAAKAPTTTNGTKAPPATSSTLPSTIPAAVVSHPSSAKATKPTGNGTKPPPAPKPALQNSTPATTPKQPIVAQATPSAAKATNKQKVYDAFLLCSHVLKLT
jgi:hypothetical protein